MFHARRDFEKKMPDTHRNQQVRLNQQVELEKPNGVPKSHFIHLQIQREKCPRKARTRRILQAFSKALQGKLKLAPRKVDSGHLQIFFKGSLV